MATIRNRTARDIALEGLSVEQRLKLLEWAEQHNIPNDDSIYWLAAILSPDQQLQQQLDQGFDLMAEAMEHFLERLVALEAVCQAQSAAEPAASQTQRPWIPLLLAVAGTLLGIAGFIWGYQCRTTSFALSGTAARVQSTLTTEIIGEGEQPDLGIDPRRTRTRQDR